MELLKQSTGQAREALTALTPLSRIIAVVMILLVLIGSAFIMRSSSTVSHELLFGGRLLVDHELDAIELAFSRAGLNAWQRAGRQIQIPKDKKAEYLAALKETSSLPFTLRNPMQEAMEASNLFDSSALRDAREMLAKEQDLGMKIAAFSDVQWASVDYDEGEKRGLSSTRQQSASVLVVPENDRPLGRSRINSIEQLVRGSFAGLQPENIVVIDANATSEEAGWDEDPLLRKQKEAEARIEQKLIDLLAGFPAKIAVSAQIDPTMDMERAVLRVESDTVHLVKPRTLVDVMGDTRSLLGARSDQASVIGTRSVSINRSEEVIEKDSAPSIIQDQKYEASRLASLQVKSVRVSVGLPTSYYEQLYAQEYSRQNPTIGQEGVPTIAEADLEKLRTKTKSIIQTAVAVLLPEQPSGYSATSLVEVWDYIDFPATKMESEQDSQAILGWLAKSWQTVLLVSVVVLALWSSLGFVRSNRLKGQSADLQLSDRDEISTSIFPNQGQAVDGPARQARSIERDLSAAFETDPETGANVIRQWMNQAA